MATISRRTRFVRVSLLITVQVVATFLLLEIALRLAGDGPVFDVETASGEIQLTIGEVWQ